MSKVICITGGIGSGKSAALNILKEAGADIIDADEIGHKALYEPDVKAALISSFGGDILNAGGEIDRKKLSFVFSDEAKLAYLNSVLHPVIIKKIRESTEDLSKKSRLIALEIPLLYECNLEYLGDIVCVVYSDINTRIKRLEERGLSRSDIINRINSQMPLEEKAAKADVLILNNGTKDDLKTEIFEKILNYL